MRTTLKLLLLIVAVVGGVIAIMVFAKTRVAPPGKVETMNQYTAHLDSVTREFVSVTEMDSVIAGNNAINHKVRLMNREGYITDAQADKAQRSADSTYAERMKEYSYRTFGASVWPELSLSAISSMANYITAQKLLNGNSSISDAQKSEIAKIRGVISKYKEAWAFSKNTGFSSVDNARTKVSKARAYKAEKYLSNNSALVSALDAMPRRIADNHYSYVAAKVHQLGNYHLDKESYKSLVRTVSSAINEYKGASYCSNKPSITDLENLANNYVENYTPCNENYTPDNYYRR